MQFESVFTSIIEVGIATAGFSGIVAALGRRSQGEWIVIQGRGRLIGSGSYVGFQSPGGSLLAWNLGAAAAVGGLCHAAERPIR